MRPIKTHGQNFGQRQDPKGGTGATPRHLRYGAAGETGSLPDAGRSHPQDPQGGAGATPRHPAPRRGEGARRPTRRAAPTLSKK